jgi:ribosomal protein S18 acetylase RimI-like enzyme
MSPVAIREASLDELERAVSVQVLAFSSDPVIRWLYPEAHEYLSHYPSFVRAFGGGAFESVTAYVENDFGGAALWLPPGVHVDGELLQSVLQESVASSRHEETFLVLEEMDRFHIEEPHWYLPMIGVDPLRQGHGIGAALLRHALAKCDEASLPAYLESSNPANIPLYERHGFSVAGTIQVGSSPPIFPMIRGAQ